MNNPSKYSDQLVEWLIELGYTHCFFVAGGNIMHLLDSVRTRMECVPFVHEVGATIAAEYFNASTEADSGKAFALVTAGPGLTNAITGIAGAWQESRELLVIGGQVKASDLSRGEIRQRGIQEIDGVKIVESICKVSELIDKPVSKKQFFDWINYGSTPRMGPVFLEICLDVQAATPLDETQAKSISPDNSSQITVPHCTNTELDQCIQLLRSAQRPILLIGGGVSRNTLRELEPAVTESGIPIMTTWNGSDRISNTHPLYCGRPDTWGQRAANILIQQSDLVIAVGARLSLQQTGFAWEQFAPLAKIVQIEIDLAEITKGHPRIDLGINCEANDFLARFMSLASIDQVSYASWIEYILEVRQLLPYNDQQNITAPGYVDPFELVNAMGQIAAGRDVLLPCSSGGAATVSMQTFVLRDNQKLVGDKSLASMGYGLSGAIGCALANKTSAVYLNEGDGGIAQNLQEFGTLAATGANVKVFIWANHGYASIRMTQKNYFNGSWIGCDSETGLGIPDWEKIAQSYGINYLLMDENMFESSAIKSALKANGPVIIEVPIDPEQTFYPKITSSIQSDGSMKSNPLHLMSPELPESISSRVLKYLNV